MRRLVRFSTRTFQIGGQSRMTAGGWLLLGIAGPGLLAMGLYAIRFHPWRIALSILATSLVVSLAALAAGSLLGFLFGIPRRVVGEDVQAAELEGGMEQIALRYTSNTNLEQISDWVTKIIVGVTLVQIRELASAARSLVVSLAGPLGDVPAASAFAGGLILFFGVAGFLLGYVSTSLHLGGALSLAERRWSQALKSLLQRELPDEGEGEELYELRLDKLDQASAEEALRLYRLVRRLEARGGIALTAKEYARLGAQLSRARRFREAEHAFLRAAEIDPMQPRYLNRAGVARAKRDDAAGASELYRQAIALDPEYGTALYNLACAEIRRGNELSAMNILAAAIATDDRYREKARSSQLFTSLRDHPLFEQLTGTGAVTSEEE